MMHPIPLQLFKLLPVLSSDKDGEVVAAARAIMRTLRREGLDIHDLVNLLTNQQAKSRDPDSKRSAHAYSDFGKVRVCYLVGGSALTEWERNFIADMNARFKGRTFAPSPRQSEIIRKIYTRVREEAA